MSCQTGQQGWFSPICILNFDVSCALFPLGGCVSVLVSVHSSSIAALVAQHRRVFEHGCVCKCVRMSSSLMCFFFFFFLASVMGHSGVSRNCCLWVALDQPLDWLQELKYTQIHVQYMQDLRVCMCKNLEGIAYSYSPNMAILYFYKY